MRRSCLFLLVLMLSVGSVTLAWQPYQTAILLEVQKKVSTTPRSYLWNTVVTYSETETYEFRIRLKDRTCVTRYTPIIQPSSLPLGWKTGQPIEVRVEKRKMFLRASYGEVETYIAKCDKSQPNPIFLCSADLAIRLSAGVVLGILPLDLLACKLKTEFFS
jgi:hypothetical protein